VVVTVTVALPLPDGKAAGFTEQVVAVAAAGSVQDKLTCEIKPLSAETEIAFGKVAGLPAVTVTEVVPEEVMEKSGDGGALTMKLNGAEAPAAIGSTTDRG
jgi:hypothetical protein